MLPDAPPRTVWERLKWRPVLDADRWTQIARDHLLAGAEMRRRTAETCLPAIRAAAEVIADAFRAGGKLLLCGNGGSAADCQHMAAEFVSRLDRRRDRPALPAVALTTDTSFLTAFANDVGFEGVFARQVQALGRPGDVLVAISTSGRSPNVVLAVETAHALKMRIVALTGGGDALAKAANVSIAIPSHDTQQVQEAHLAVEHAVCALVEAMLFDDRGDQ